MFGRWCPPIDSQGAQVMPEAEELSVRPATHARTQMHSKCLAAACPHAQSSALALETPAGAPAGRSPARGAAI